MTKDKLEKEAGESWWNDNNCSGALSTKKIYICGYLAGAEPREKRIAEQEELLNSTLEENKDIYKKMADLDTALEDCSLTDARIKIKELEKENAELKVYNEKLLNSDIEKHNKIVELNDKLNNLSKVAEVRLANWQKYEQENAELKERADKADLDSVTFFNQLCKAKELLEDLIKFQPYIDREAFFISLGNEWKTAIYRAEQFLKEDK